MDLRGARALVVLVPLALWLSMPRLAEAGEGPAVREIVVRGFRGDATVITDLMQTKEGQPIDGAVLNDDLARLLRAGYVVSFRQEIIPGGIRLLVDIVESLRVGVITITGAGRSWNKKLRDEILTRPGDPISAAVLDQPEEQRYRGDKSRIHAWCQQRGYRNVAIVSETARAPGAQTIDIVFTVSLGPKFQVKWLQFVGNRGISSRELGRRIQTKRDAWWSSRRYYERFFEEDVVGLQDFYRFSGYPNARVTYRQSFHGRRGNKVKLTIFIEEGQQYPVTRLAFDGNQVVSDDSLLAVVPMELGAPYSDASLLASRVAVERHYQEMGHPFVAVRPQRELNAETDGYEVRFQIDEGEKIRINMIRTSGHPRTRRDVILRELELEPGMTYDSRLLDRSRRGLNRLQFFDEINMRLVPTDPPMAGERDLQLDLVEGRTGYFRFGLGFSSANAFIGAIELTQRNFDYTDTPKDWADLLSGNAFVGAGQFFRIGLFPGTVLSSYVLQYENPYWGGRNQSFGWSLYWRSRDQGEWIERRFGLRLTRGIRKYKGDPDTDVVFHLRVEAVSVLEADLGEAPDDAHDEEGTHPLLGFGVTVRRDRTDRPILPTSGYEWDGGPEVVVPHGIKIGVGGTRFWTVGDRPPGHERVFSVRGRADYAAGTFPIYERYYAGAPLIRGFEYRGAGPHDNGEPEGGKYRVALSTEYRHPVIADRLYTVLFVDAGTVTSDFSLFTSPRVAVGIGFRLLVPQISRAPISLDLGVPVVKQGDDDTEIFYFSISVDR